MTNGTCEQCGERDALTIAHYEYADGYRVQRAACGQCAPLRSVTLTDCTPPVTMALSLDAGAVS